ncbi:MAG: protein-L-isoaspartate(D-aspartate) O-methyltransferase [Candidatus Binatia bacterium]|nr:protein-L-isoaspartate(D-aspartate) O-methyltransferase [Candidatus Binatia bacterium]
MPQENSNDFLEQAKNGLLEELRAEGVTDPRVIDALRKVPREEFVRPHDRDAAYDNRALPIGKGQTISQPLIVGLMTQLLGLTGKERVLEVGTGSGYQAAVLSQLCQEVYSIEIDPELAEGARQRLARLGYNNVYVRAGDGFFGWPEAAPFDATIITAVAPRVPEPLLAQLKPNGVIVMPLEEGWGETLVRVRKLEDGSTKVERFGAVAFVPMRGAIRSKETRH